MHHNIIKEAHMRIMHTLFLIVLSFIFISGQSCSQSKAPEFNLRSADNQPVTMSKLAGKLVVVNFWATWCRPCVVEMPGFSEIYEKYKGKGLEIVGVSLDNDGWGKVRPFLAKNKVAYPIVIGDQDLYLAFGGRNAIPTTVFVDKKGNIIETVVGMMQKDDFEKKIKKLL